MKLKTYLVAIALSAPLLSFAQENSAPLSCQAIAAKIANSSSRQIFFNDSYWSINAGNQQFEIEGNKGEQLAKKASLQGMADPGFTVTLKSDSKDPENCLYNLEYQSQTAVIKLNPIPVLP